MCLVVADILWFKENWDLKDGYSAWWLAKYTKMHIVMYPTLLLNILMQTHANHVAQF